MSFALQRFFYVAVSAQSVKVRFDLWADFRIGFVAVETCAHSRSVGKVVMACGAGLLYMVRMRKRHGEHVPGGMWYVVRVSAVGGVQLRDEYNARQEGTQ